MRQRFGYRRPFRRTAWQGSQPAQAGPARTFPSFYPGICAACGFPFLKDAQVVLNVAGQGGRPSGRGHADPGACAAAAQDFRRVHAPGPLGPIDAFEHVENVVLPDGTAVLRTVGVIVAFGRVEYLLPDGNGTFSDGGVIEAIRSGGEVRSTRGRERLYHADRFSKCSTCAGLIVSSDWILYGGPREVRHAVAARCLPGAWSTRRVKGLGNVWSGPQGVFICPGRSLRSIRSATPEEVLVFGGLVGKDIAGLDWVLKDLDVEARTENADFLSRGPGSERVV